MITLGLSAAWTKTISILSPDALMARWRAAWWMMVSPSF
jgi:hypothetical protein